MDKDMDKDKETGKNEEEEASEVQGGSGALPPGWEERAEQERRSFYDGTLVGTFYGVDEYGESLGAQPKMVMPTHWSVPWSDLMMVMFIFFAVLFTYSISHQDLDDAFDRPNKEHTSPRPETVIKEPTFVFDPEDLFKPTPENIPILSQEDIFRESIRVANEADLKNIDVILQDDRSVKISVSGPMSFGLATAVLRKDARLFLDKIAEVLKPIENEIQVVGHTDDNVINSDRYPSNWELSAARATNMVRYLISRGLQPERFTVKAHSMYRPGVPNTTADNRERNRRVEIVILKEAK